MPTAGAMISPGGQRRAVVDGDDADAVHVDGRVGLQRVGGLDGAADDDGAEAVDLGQLLLPAGDGLCLALAEQVGRR